VLTITETGAVRGRGKGGKLKVPSRSGAFRRNLVGSLEKRREPPMGAQQEGGAQRRGGEGREVKMDVGGYQGALVVRVLPA